MVQFEVRQTRYHFVAVVATIFAGLGFATMIPTAASAAGLYCNRASSLWDECVYSYTNSAGQTIIEAQSHDSRGAILGHTEIIGSGGYCSGTVYSNSPDQEVLSGEAQYADLNFGLADSCHNH